MKKVLILVFVTFALLMHVGYGGSNAIVIYSSLEQYRGEELQRQLNEKFPDENILVFYVSTAKSAAKISVEKEKTDADIVVGLETAYMEKISNYLADISNVKTQNYLTGLEPEENNNKYITWERQAGSIIINTQVLDKYGLEIPKTYEDLLKEEFKGLVAMPDPKTSGTGYFFYKNMVNVLGDEAALDYFDRLQKNIKSFTESGSGPIKLLTQGEIAVGLGLTFQAVEEINNGLPFITITPEYGSPYSLTGSGIIKSKENNQLVQEVFEFIANDFLVYDKENFSPEPIYHNQNNKIENYPKNIEYADMCGISDISEKERLLELWKY